jgi:hypothetical protein
MIEAESAKEALSHFFGDVAGSLDKLTIIK